MSADQKELYSLLIPLRNERLLVPRMCVAEVIAFADTERPPDDSGPEWLLGTIEWNGRRLPVVSFDTSAEVEGPGVRKRPSRSRIVVFHAITDKLKSGFYGILTQGFPQLVRVNPDVISLDQGAELPPGQPMLCRVRMIHEFPLIPDVERLEEMLGSLPATAA
jgi:chemosensory pili system protein ChpC